MKTVSWIGFLLGLAVVALLVAWQGMATIAERLTASDWAILLVVLFAVPDLILRAASWRLLFAPGRAPRFGDTVRAMWMGSSVNTLLPVASIGGEVVKVRLLRQRSVRGVDAVASVVVGKTVQAVAVLLWALVGIAILVVVAPDRQVVTATLIGAVLLAVGICGFIVVQRAGAFEFLARWATRVSRTGEWRSLVDRSADVDAAIRDLYRRPRVFLGSTGLRLVARVLMAGEVWLAAWLIGYPIDLVDAVLLKSLGIAVRSAAFVVPGGFGLQEGSYIVVGALVGLPPDVMLTVSLATRLRELVVAVPGFVAWQRAEGWASWRRRVDGAAPSSRGEADEPSQ